MNKQALKVGQTVWASICFGNYEKTKVYEGPVKINGSFDEVSNGYPCKLPGKFKLKGNRGYSKLFIFCKEIKYLID